MTRVGWMRRVDTGSFWPDDAHNREYARQVFGPPPPGTGYVFAESHGLLAWLLEVAWPTVNIVDVYLEMMA